MGMEIRGEVHALLITACITWCQLEGGATRSLSRGCTNAFGACVTPLGGREAQPAALLTRSGVSYTVHANISGGWFREYGESNL